MRIGLDVSKAAGAADGIGIYCRELLRTLPELLDDDELWLYAPLGELDFQTLGQELGGWAQGVRPRPNTPPAKDELDLFHSTCWTAPPGLRVPLLFTCHDLTFLTHEHCHTLHNRVHCTTGLLRAQLQDATFLAVSEATAYELHHQFGISPAHTHVVPHAAAPHFKPQPDAAQRLADSLNLEGPFLLAVGTLEPRKNLSRLLDAYAALKHDLRQQWPLVLAGSPGWLADDLLSHLESDPQLATVRHLGRVSDDILVDLYSTAGLFVYPSLAEGFGLPLLEAMACGAPVLTSRGGATEETAGDAARLVDPHSTDDLLTALEELLTDPDARQALSQAGQKRARTFSWASTARRTLALYHRLAG